jgi:DeoR family suf operon transcriptional repressor
MSTQSETSDKAILDYLRRSGAATVIDLAREMGVTSTAIRQRLQRLMADGVIARRTQRKGRGRPNHRYSLTDKGERLAGSNFADLAIVLWEEVKGVEDPDLRRGLVHRIADRLAELYRGRISGQSLRQRMESLVGLMDERDIPFEADFTGELPVLSALACPFPELAKLDRSVCTMEKLMLTGIFGEGVQMNGCRLDGDPCCTFSLSETSPATSETTTQG